jgi:hypothetical protein
MIIQRFQMDSDTETFTMPRRSKVLSALAQFGKICIWVETDPDLPEQERRTFVACQTGRELDFEQRTFIGTVISKSMVFHVYEVIG